MEIRTRDIEIEAVDGAMPVFVAEPETAGPHPAVIVIMEAFGRVQHICDVASRIAREGYVAVAPDLYYREGAAGRVPYNELPRALELLQQFDDAKFLDDMRTTLTCLRGLDAVGNSKIGVIGFCMGGRLTFVTACSLPGEIAAAAPFYGAFTVEHLPQADAIQCPLYLFFGEEDPYIPAEEVEAIGNKLEELGKRYQLKSYAGADHGFFCDERESFNEAASADAWTELKRFFADTLR